MRHQRLIDVVFLAHVHTMHASHQQRRILGREILHNSNTCLEFKRDISQASHLNARTITAGRRV